jgi:hypothetical protein
MTDNKVVCGKFLLFIIFLIVNFRTFFRFIQSNFQKIHPPNFISFKHFNFRVIKQNKLVIL